MGEVRVQAEHVAGGREPVGQVDGEQELLEVDLAGRGEEAAPGPDRLGERLPGRAHGAHRVAAGRPEQGGPERAQVGAQPRGDSGCPDSDVVCCR